VANHRREDDAHDVGDSTPGTVGDSQGTVYDRRGAPSFDPNDIVEFEGSHQSSHRDSKQENGREDTTEENRHAETEEKDTKRMRYAKKYGDSWPEDRKRRFLNEYDVSGEEMGWRLKG